MKVIIVGGGIAGLTLANALEHADIDFLLLEARSLLDPQVGASIGIGPHGLRILDQFGAAQKILDNTVPMTYSRPHRQGGSLIGAPQPMFTLFEPRLGYGLSFLDRQLVLRAAANTIKQKRKLLLNKRMKAIDHTSTGVTVHCEDGTSYDGDMVIGADGVNSGVRKEMWRIAGQEDPSYFPSSEKTKMTAEYRCLFGISDRVPGLESPGVIDLCFDKGKSFLVITGKRKRVFWFYFEKLDKVYKHSEPDFPRYTPADAEKVAADNMDRKFHERVTLGDLWKTRVSYTLVPMEEALFDKWSWGRIATIGDCAHKMTANHGQAGNNAIESAAALANQLYALNAAHKSSTKPLTTSEISCAFKKWQAKRQTRIEATCKEAALVCRYSVLDSVMAYIFHFFLVPNSQSLLANMQCNTMYGAELLEWLPVPPRSLKGTMPFNQHQGTARSESMLIRALKASPLLFISWFVWSKTPDSRSYFNDRLYDMHHPSGVENEQMVRIVIYELCHIMFYAVRDLESGRRANSLNLFLRFPIIFALAAEIYGIGVVMPLYFFIHYISSGVSVFAAADMRLMNVRYIRSILPSLILTFAGLLAPIALDKSLNPLIDSWLTVARLLTPVAMILQQKLFVWRSNEEDTESHDAIHDLQVDLPIIRKTIIAMMALGAGVFQFWKSGGGSIVWIPSSSPLSKPSPPPSPPQSNPGPWDTIDWNHYGILYAGVFWIFLLFWDLCLAGMTTYMESLGWFALYLGVHSVTPLTVRPLIDVSFVLIAWEAREEFLAEKRERHAVTQEKYGGGKSVLEVEGRGCAAGSGDFERRGQENGDVERKVEDDGKLEKLVNGYFKKENGIPKAVGVEVPGVVATG